MQYLDFLIKQDYNFALDAGLILAVTLVISLMLRIIQRRLMALLIRTETRWDDVVLESISLPLQWLIWVVGITAAVDISVVHFVTDASRIDQVHNAISVGRQMAVIVLVAWLLWRLITRVSSQKLDSGSDPTTVQVVGKIAKLTVIVLIVLPVFELLGISISGILAFGGVGGLVVGLASKDLLANFFGSLIIYLDRPFKVGDWVRSSDREIEGTVEEIGFRVTRIRTFDKRPLYVPNSVFTNILVENPSRMSHRRINETFGIRYQDSAAMAHIVTDVKQMLIDHPEIDESQTLIVNFNGCAASSLDFFIYCFTHTVQWVRYHEIKQDVLLKVMAIINQHGADCAFPTQTLYMEQDVSEMEAQP